MIKTVAVVPAAGKGIRFKKKRPKPLVLLDSYPIVVHTLKILARNKFIDNIILVVNKNDLASFERKVKQYSLKKVKKIVVGGATRRVSEEA